MDKKIIIIGAGVAGLASGLRLQHAGFDVHIIEKGNNVGGKMNQVKFDGFTFDLGPTIVMMPDIYQQLFTDIGLNHNEYIPMTKLDPLMRVYYPDQSTIDVSQHLEVTLDTIAKIDEQAAIGYNKYMATMHERYIVARDSFILKSFRKSSDFYNFHMLGESLKLKTFSSSYQSLAKYIKNEKIQQLLAFQTLYIGISPYQGPSIYNIIPLIQTLYGITYMPGGMYTLARQMEKVFLERGGKITFNQSIDKIVIENDRIIGVEAGKEVIKSEYVLNTADFPYALKNLLPKDFKHHRYSSKKIEKLQYSASCFMFYFGVKGVPAQNLSMHNIVLANDFSGNINNIFSNTLTDDNSMYIYVPGVLDSSLAPKEHFGLYVLIPVPNLQDGDSINWNDEKLVDDLKKQALEKINRLDGMDDIENRIVGERCITPFDFDNSFNAQYGATFGLKPTLLQSNYYRPQAKSMQVEGLYFAGSSVHPGAGVPIVLTSAKIAVEEILRDTER